VRKIQVRGCCGGESDSEKTDEAAEGKILHENRDSILRGYRDTNKTYEAIKQHYYWSNKKEEIKECIRKGQLNDVLRAKEKEPMEITQQPVILLRSAPWISWSR
jgi:hypothetical protein